MGETQVTAPPQRIIELPASRINHYFTKSSTANQDGSRLYVGVGSNSNAGERGPEAEAGRADIWEVDPKTGAHLVFAAGTRNPNGLTFYPGSNRLWAVVNERDELGPNLVPDYMTWVRPGAFYGGPYSYYRQRFDPRVQPQRPDLVARAIPPDYAPLRAQRL
jgi:glucose/arabinose dehydrogenase